VCVYVCVCETGIAWGLGYRSEDAKEEQWGAVGDLQKCIHTVREFPESVREKDRERERKRAKK